MKASALHKGQRPNGDNSTGNKDVSRSSCIQRKAENANDFIHHVFMTALLPNKRKHRFPKIFGFFSKKPLTKRERRAIIAASNRKTVEQEE